MEHTLECIKNTIRVVEDFPVKGVLFRDLSPVYSCQGMLKDLADLIAQHYKNCNITKVIGVEARGFILGSMIAERLNAGFVMCRKPNKLPVLTVSASYHKEYGFDTLAIPFDAVNSDDVVLVHDDLLATGGTIQAVVEILQLCRVSDFYINTTVALSDKGCTRLKLPFWSPIVL